MFYTKHNQAISEFYPGYPINGIMEAWNEPKRAFNLTWLEIEILTLCSNWTSIQYIRSYLENRYLKEDIKSESSFYRILKHLVDNGYLIRESMVEKGSLVQITDKGALELGRFERYHTEKIITRIQFMLIRRIIRLIRSETGCLHNKLFVSYTFKDFFVKKTLEMCSLLDTKEKHTDTAHPNYFLYLDENQLSKNDSKNNLDYFKIENDGKINLKENLAEVFIGGGLLTDLIKNNNEEIFSNVMNELKRIIKSNGTFYFMEQIIDYNSLIMKYFSMISQLKEDDTTMNLKKAVLSKEVVLKSISDYFPKFEVTFEDIFLVVKASL